MPKPISPEQLESLLANGVVVLGYETPATAPSTSTSMEAGLLLRTLGSVGLPRTEPVGQIEHSAKPNGFPVEIIIPEGFEERFNKAHDSATILMGLVGETVSSRSEFQANLAEIGKTFADYVRLGLKPDVVLTPTGRNLNFWENVAKKLQESQHNPDSGESKLLRSGGLWVSDTIKGSWTSLVSRPGEAPSWDLSVVSGKNEPEVVNVTSYGYTKKGDLVVPSSELNKLLRELDLPEVTSQSGQTIIPTSNIPAPAQPKIHPYVDTYLMHQFTRIIESKDPVDINTFSWLKGVLPNGFVSSGDWDPAYGQVSLGRYNADNLRDNVGVRPSGRG